MSEARPPSSNERTSDLVLHLRKHGSEGTDHDEILNMAADKIERLTNTNQDLRRRIEDLRMTLHRIQMIAQESER